MGFVLNKEDWKLEASEMMKRLRGRDNFDDKPKAIQKRISCNPSISTISSEVLDNDVHRLLKKRVI